MPKQNKFKSVLVHKAKEDILHEKSQKQLREKHGITDENIVVVEKSNTYKFTINNLKALIQLASRIIIMILAIIGLMGLIYPVPRAALFSIINEATRQLQEYLGPFFSSVQNLNTTAQQIVHQL